VGAGYFYVRTQKNIVAFEPIIAAPERYEGRPFLRLIDCYLLDIIGHLDESQRESLGKMTVRFQKTFSTSASTWQAIVEEQLDLLPQARESIAMFWEGFVQHQKAHDQDPSPIAFVMHFTEQNFSSYVHEVP
jgi:hypothetical protein